MKKNFTWKFLILIFGVIGLANAQRVIQIAPTEFGIINTVINGDTLANGDRVDPNTIYELERGVDKYYVFNGTISNVDYHLHIRSAGEGDRPKLVPGVLQGGVAERLFTPRGDITLEGLYLSGIDNTNISSFNHLMSMAAENIRITIDDCLLHGNRSNCFELDAQNQSAYVTNSILSYTFLNGRGIDRRGNLLDTLVVQNSTFINIGSEPLRWGGSNYAKYIKFDHVTWCATGESIGNFGEVVDFTFTNNMIINAGYKGTEDDGSPSRIFNIEPLTSPDLAGETQSITVRNNNLWLDPQIANLYGNLDVSSGSNNIPVMARPFGDSLTHTLIDTTTFLNEPIEFTFGPSVDTLMAALRQIWEELDGDRDGGTIFDTGPEGVNIFGNPIYGIFPFDLSYPTTTQSYITGEGGFPLGDLNWFPDKKAEWEVYEPLNIVVDGQKDDFYNSLTGPDDGYLQIRSFAFNDNGAPDDDADLSSKVWAAWDNEWFYVYNEVMDDILSGNSSDPWQNDCIELKFDAQPTDSVTNSIWDVRLTIDPENVVAGDSLNNVADENKMWARTTIEGGYALELAIKWSAIGHNSPETNESITPAVDAIFGLGIANHDNDASSREASIQWSAVLLDAMWNTPKYLGTAKLLADNKVQFIPTNNMTGVTNPLPYDGTSVDVDQTSSLIPKEFGLSQNYPNPFNPSTTIEFALPKQAAVELAVYNLLGERVAVLINQELSPGYHEIAFNADLLPSGVYFYRIQAGSFVQTKKLMLLK